MSTTSDLDPLRSYRKRSCCSMAHSNSTWRLVFVIVALITLLAPLPAASVQLKKNDIQNFLVALEGSDTSPGKDGAKSASLSTMWGLPDATAVVGKLFQYPIPKDAFKGEPTAYKVVEAGQKLLPSWLHYDDSRQTLQGIPSPEELGNQIFIQVIAHGPYKNETTAQSTDIFAVSVMDEEDYNDIITMATPLQDHDNSIKPIKCPHTSSVTMATIIMDIELSMLQAQDRVAIMRELCKHLDLVPEHLSLLPVGNKPMFDSSALVAGPGDVKHPQHSGAVFQWVVGCGNVQAEHMPILEEVETSSNDGSMSKALGHGVIGWHVTNNKLQSLQRMKRQAHYMPTATLMPTVGPPTRQPVPTVIVDETDHPVTRVVPTMASPIFTTDDVKPTKTHHHHHHRSKSSGRHHHPHKTHHPHHPHHTQHPHHSPKHHGTKTMKTVMPTATLQPIMPTRVIDITPTLIDTSMGRVSPTFGIASPGVSRTSLLEPSHTFTHPAIRTETTQILPTRTFVMPDTTATEAVIPSKTDTTTSTQVTKPFVPPTPPTPPPSPSTPKTRKPKPDTKPMPDTTTKPGKPGKTPRPPKSTITTTTDSPITTTYNYAPILKNNVDRVSAVVGEVLEYKIDPNTFHDFEDGDTNTMKLVFLTVDGLSITPNSWVQFNQTTQTLYGLPMPDDEGRKEYMMVAIDSGGKMGRDAFEIVVSRRPHDKKINHEFSVTLDLDYQKFLTDVNQRIDIARKIARAFGDPDASKITVTKIASGSVVYSWTNNSIPSNTCPQRAIGDLVKYIMNSINNTLNETFVKAMAPYKVLKAGVQPQGACSQDKLPPVETSTDPPEDPGAVETVPRESTDEEFLITTVVPAVVIACILLLAACIACIFYRKRRKGKLSDEDQHTFVNKGIPIIFADELEDRPDPASKPLILNDEKPPLPPPSYARSSSHTPPSTPCSGHKDPYDTEDDNYESSMTQPLYQPPPPFTGTGSGGRRHQRPRVQPAYRNPPPYVPP